MHELLILMRTAIFEKFEAAETWVPAFAGTAEAEVAKSSCRSGYLPGPEWQRELRAADAVKNCEAVGQDLSQVVAIGACLPVLAHRDERHVLPELLLQIDADPLLLLQIRRF